MITQELTIPLPWQQQQWQQLHQLQQQQRLPHALLLAGPEGLGQSQFAHDLVKRLLCEQDAEHACGRCRSCQLMAAGTHPDFVNIQPEETTIKIDQIRAVRDLLTKTATHNRQVVLIEPAEAMNLASANALLKTLEEPSGQAIVILVSYRIEGLPITVRSRCQVQYFTSPDQTQTIQWLNGQGEFSDKLAAALAFCQDLPVATLGLLTDESSFAKREQWLAELSQFMQGETELTILAEKWAKDPIVDMLTFLVGVVMACIQYICAQQTNFLVETLAIHRYQLDTVDLFSLLDKLYENKRLLSVSNSVNAQLMLEHSLYYLQQVKT